MTAYEPDAWHDFLIMTGGASAALAGLLFVAVSLNLEQILKFTALPSLAAASISMLLAVVLACCFGLVPGQPAVALGIELLVLGSSTASLLFVLVSRSLSRLEQLGWRVSRLLMTAVSTIPMVVAGVSLMAGDGGGLYWLLVGVVASVTTATYNAWVLLIEIRR
ncbi:hypothetical protein E6C70_12235 [Glaciibacter flavus]|uniref:Modulator of FtsH protease n=1 Tax=Orlajensenia flava TaxID=2565934 RepID=A0A4S4FPP5_9MICO|nr:hypothetical protein [Glaciibacter flavus]THG32520.1 hypothetical protein E6C70_12235 [Glaciibacter flavus]